MKTCGKCKKTLELSAFSRKGNGHQSSCKICRKEWYDNYYRTSDKEKIRLKIKRDSYRIKARELIKKTKKVPCMDCNIEYPYYVMDFDHRDPSTKKFNISEHADKSSLKRLKEEIDKCDVICSNCHRIRTFEQNK